MVHVHLQRRVHLSTLRTHPWIFGIPLHLLKIRVEHILILLVVGGRGRVYQVAHLRAKRVPQWTSQVAVNHGRERRGHHTEWVYIGVA